MQLFFNIKNFRPGAFHLRAAKQSPSTPSKGKKRGFMVHRIKKDHEEPRYIAPEAKMTPSGEHAKTPGGTKFSRSKRIPIEVQIVHEAEKIDIFKFSPATTPSPLGPRKVFSRLEGSTEPPSPAPKRTLFHSLPLFAKGQHPNPKIPRSCAPSQNSVMGSSATGVTGKPDSEWLHIIAHSLVHKSGKKFDPQTSENLCAASKHANTYMIIFESIAARLAEEYEITYTVKFELDTTDERIANHIHATIEIPNQQKPDQPIIMTFSLPAEVEDAPKRDLFKEFTTATMQALRILYESAKSADVGNKVKLTP